MLWLKPFALIDPSSAAQNLMLRCVLGCPRSSKVEWLTYLTHMWSGMERAWQKKVIPIRSSVRLRKQQTSSGTGLLIDNVFLGSCTSC